jgi:hypothetical protein
LKTDLERESSEVKRLKKVDQEILNIKVELNEVQIKLRETSLELDKTQAKNRSLVKHEQVSVEKTKPVNPPEWRGGFQRC